MKKLLKFILMPILVTTPALTVVACSDNSQIAPDQVLNIAVGRILNGANFKMAGDPQKNNDDLGLGRLPADKSQYNSLSGDALNKITNHFKALVTAGSGSSAGDWEYPSVNVNITEWTSMPIKNPPPYITFKTAPDIQGSIYVQATLSYSGLTKEVSTRINIFNDQTSNNKKAAAIADIVKQDFNDNINRVIDFKTLPRDGIKGDDLNKGELNTVLNSFASYLRDYWVNTSKNDTSDHQPLIDFIGTNNLAISITPDIVTNSIYQLNDDSSLISSDQKYIEGTISNLNINFSYSSPYDPSVGIATLKTSELTSTTGKIKIQQNIDSDLKNQLTSFISPNSMTLLKNSLSVTTFPTATSKWSDFAPANSDPEKAVKNGIFNGVVDPKPPITPLTKGIFSVYPEAKTDIKEADFTINDNGVFHIIGSAGSKQGYFFVTFTLKYKLDGLTEATINSNPVQIYLNDN